MYHEHTRSNIYFRWIQVKSKSSYIYILYIILVSSTLTTLHVLRVFHLCGLGFGFVRDPSLSVRLWLNILDDGGDLDDNQISLLGIGFLLSHGIDGSLCFIRPRLKLLATYSDKEHRVEGR